MVIGDSKKVIIPLGVMEGGKEGRVV